LHGNFAERLRRLEAQDEDRKIKRQQLKLEKLKVRHKLLKQKARLAALRKDKMIPGKNVSKNKSNKCEPCCSKAQLDGNDTSSDETDSVHEPDNDWIKPTSSSSSESDSLDENQDQYYTPSEKSFLEKSHSSPFTTEQVKTAKSEKKLPWQMPNIENETNSVSGTETDYAFVTSFELDIDSHPSDQLKIVATRDECCEAYLRFLGQ